jgi:hypothetical protein
MVPGPRGKLEEVHPTSTVLSCGASTLQFHHDRSVGLTTPLARRWSEARNERSVRPRVQ